MSKETIGDTFIHRESLDYKYDWSGEIPIIKLESIGDFFRLMDSGKSENSAVKDSIFDFNILSNNFSDDEKVVFFRRLFNIKKSEKLDEDDFEEINKKLILAKRFLLKQSSNISKKVLGVEIHNEKDLIKLFYKSSTRNNDNVQAERTSYYSLIKSLFLSSEVLEVAGNDEVLEIQNKAMWEFWSNSQGINDNGFNEEKGRRNVKINNVHTEVRGPRLKELLSAMTKASIKEGMDIERFFKDIFAMEIHVKREDLSIILETVVDGFTKSEDWDSEDIYEIKNKNWLNEKQVVNLNKILEKYTDKRIKMNENQLSQGSYTSFSINFEMFYPDIGDKGNVIFDKNNNKKKVKRMIEVKFVPMDYKHERMEVDPLYKLPQLLISKYKVMGPGILTDDVKMMIEKTILENRQSIDEDITTEMIYQTLVEKLFIERGDYFVLRDTVDKMTNDELNKIFPE